MKNTNTLRNSCRRTEQTHQTSYLCNSGIEEVRNERSSGIQDGVSSHVFQPWNVRFTAALWGETTVTSWHYWYCLFRKSLVGHCGPVSLSLLEQITLYVKEMHVVQLEGNVDVMAPAFVITSFFLASIPEGSLPEIITLQEDFQNQLSY